MNKQDYIDLGRMLLPLLMLVVVVFALCRIQWRSMWHWLVTVKPVVVDGLLYALIAMFGAIVGIFSSDEVYKYVSPGAVFWTRTCASVMLATASALKMFRSTSYGEHRAAVDKQETNKQQTP